MRDRPLHHGKHAGEVRAHQIHLGVLALAMGARTAISEGSWLAEIVEEHDTHAEAGRGNSKAMTTCLGVSGADEGMASGIVRNMKILQAMIYCVTMIFGCDEVMKA